MDKKTKSGKKKQKRIHHRVKSVIMIVCFCILTSILFSRLMYIAEKKESNYRYTSLITEKNKMDLLILGSSHLRHTLMTQEMWQDAGIAAYNLASDGATPAMAYWSLMNALDYQSPSVVVMDVFNFYPYSTVSPVWGHLQDSYDYLPLSWNKIAMVNDLFQDPEQKDTLGRYMNDLKWDLLFEFRLYHNRWNEIKAADFASFDTIRETSMIWRGNVATSIVVEREITEYPENMDEVELDSLSMTYFQKTIDLCKEKNIQLILVNTGYDCDAPNKRLSQAVEELAKEQNIDYIDWTEMDLVDFDTDLSTAGVNTHLNFSGALKVTAHMTNYLSTHADLPDRREDPRYASWQEYLDDYKQEKIRIMNSQEDPVSYMVTLADDDFDVYAQLVDPAFLQSGKSADMLENLSVDLEEAVSGGMVVLNASDSQVQVFEPFIGEEETEEGIRLVSDSETTGILVNDQPAVFENKDNAVIRFIVTGASTNQAVSIKTFTYEDFSV